MKQRTLLREVSLKGKALHTGEEVNMTIKPAPENHGIVFKRLDIYGKPVIKPLIDFVEDLVRSTTIADGHTKVHTVEHVLSALNGCSVDNVLIEMDASEPPIMDGSAKHFVNLIQKAEPVEQNADKEYFTLENPVSVTKGNSSIIALPYDGFKITCTSSDDRGVHTQHLSIDIDIESYITHISAARTFTVYEDIEELIKLGKIKGGTLDSAILGRACLKKELYFSAIKSFNESLTLEPEQVSILALRANAYRIAQNYKAALVDIQAAIELAPELGELNYILGLIHFEMGLLDGANMAFQKVFPYLKEDSNFLLLSAQLAYTVDDLPFAKKTLDCYFQLTDDVAHINAHYIDLLLKDSDSTNNIAKPQSLDWVFFENYVNKKNSTDYILTNSSSASLTFFMAQVAKAKKDLLTEKRLLETTIERAKKNTPEYLCANWQLKALEN